MVTGSPASYVHLETVAAGLKAAPRAPSPR
jgi:hypothetical protein